MQTENMMLERKSETKAIFKIVPRKHYSLNLFKALQILYGNKVWYECGKSNATSNCQPLLQLFGSIS